MAILKSEETTLESYFELKGYDLVTQTLKAAFPITSPESQTWQKFSFQLKAGCYRLIAENDQADILLCRNPVDEVACLHEQIQQLVGHEKEEIIFEPAEPSFELKIMRTDEGGFTVVIWIDAGNAASGFYHWNAAGLRLYTSRQALCTFADQLKAELLSP